MGKVTGIQRKVVIPTCVNPHFAVSLAIFIAKMVSIKRASLLFILLPLLGSIIFCLGFITVLRGSFTKWETLGRPTTSSIKLIRINYVESATGDFYKFQNNSNCTNNCWVKVETIPPALDSLDWLSVEDCNSSFDIPSLSDYSDYLIECKRWGTGILVTIQAIGHDGNVQMWHKGQDDFGDGLLLTMSPIIGAAGGLILAILLFVIVLIRVIILNWPK